MATMIVRHRVADYAKWKSGFDAQEKARRGAGFVTHTVHRDAADPNVVVVVSRLKDVRKAEAFLDSQSPRPATTRAGAQGAPEVWVLEDMEERQY